LNQKIVNINGYDVEVPMDDNLVVMVYDDRPGIVAIYGSAFAEAEVNIAAMQIARKSEGGKALSVITVDSPVSPEILDQIQSKTQADYVRAVTLTEV